MEKTSKHIFGIDVNNKKIIKSYIKKNEKLKAIYADTHKILERFNFKPSISFKDLIIHICKHEKLKNN